MPSLHDASVGPVPASQIAGSSHAPVAQLPHAPHGRASVSREHERVSGTGVPVPVHVALAQSAGVHTHGRVPTSSHSSSKPAQIPVGVQPADPQTSPSRVVAQPAESVSYLVDGTHEPAMHAYEMIGRARAAPQVAVVGLHAEYAPVSSAGHIALVVQPSHSSFASSHVRTAPQRSIVCPLHVPPMQTSVPLQKTPSSQPVVFGAASCVHPVPVPAGSHASIVHGLVSAQDAASGA